MSARRPLEGVRVVDFTWWRAGPWATRILACLGAEVIKVEWPQPPLAYHRDRNDGLGPDLNGNPVFSENSVGKRSVTVNLRTARGLEAIKRLIRISDVVVENFSAGLLQRRGLGYPSMRTEKPDIVYVSMAGLGHTGRCHEYRTFGPVVQALSGLSHMAGLPGKEPALWRWAYMDDTGGMYGAICALVALHYRDVTGHGQHVDLAQVSAAMPLTGAAWLDYTVNDRPTRRDGFPAGNRTYEPGFPLGHAYRGPTTAPHNTYRTRSLGDAHNAWCAIACFDDDEWRALVRVMGSPGWADDPRFGTTLARLEHQVALDGLLEEWTRQHEKYALMQMCQAAGVHAMPVQDARDRVDSDPQLAARGLLQELPHAVIGPWRYQRLPFRGSDMDLRLRTAGPLAGEHNVPVLCGLLGLRPSDLDQGYRDGTFWPSDLPVEEYLLAALRSAEDSTASGVATEATRAEALPTAAHRPIGSALDGVRVLELGDVQGQWAAKLLGDLGADVIKVEPPAGCAQRLTGPFYQDNPHPDRSLSFWHNNTSKRGVTLDIEVETGRQLLRKLIVTADVLIDSYRPGYLLSLGFGYEQLKLLNPRLIVCSVTAFGQTGPWRDYLSADLLHLAAGGQMAICGYDEEEEPDAPPIALGGGQAWFMGGHYAFIAIAAALHQRHLTGAGQYLDVSIHEACSLTTEEHVPRYLARQEVSPRNRRYRPTDRQQFRCRDGAYVSAQWSSEMTPDHVSVLAYWMDDYGLAGDLLHERYRDQQVINASTDHIAHVLARFFASIDSEEAYHGAQQRGFAFGAVRTVADNVRDEHWADRGFCVPVRHAELNREFIYPGAYAVFGATPWALSRPAPTLGQHTAEVFGKVGVDALQLAALRHAHVV